MTTITIKEYFALAGSKLSDKDARVIGPVLAELSQAKDVDTAAVVEAAKSANCPLHAYFEWDDSVAANHYREGQAAEIINTVRVRFTSDDDGAERTVRAYRIAQARSDPQRIVQANVKLGRDKDVMSEPNDLEEVIGDALRDLQQWRIKYRPYAEQFAKFKDVSGVILNQIAEFMDEFAQADSSVKPLEAIEDLRLWAQQHGIATGVAGQFAEQFRYMMAAIEDAERVFDPDAGLESPLARENRMLRERLAELEGEALGGPQTMAIQHRLGLTRKEAGVLAILLERNQVSAEAVMVALYSGGSGDRPDDKIIDVFVCKVRKKVGPLGITIETIWGVGYTMPEASKARLRSMLEQPTEIAA